MKYLRFCLSGFVLLLLIAFLSTSTVRADGTEQLGPPANLTLATGSGIRADGTGMVNQPGIVKLTIPDNVVIKQVLLYWEGQMSTNIAGDSTIRINGTTEVTGALIGGPTRFFGGAFSSAFRADITSLNLITSGLNQITLDQLAFTRVANGAGIIVIFDDGAGLSTINLHDGLDLAFINFAEPRKNTVAQTFTFAPSGVERVATITYFASSVAGAVSGQGARPESFEVTVNGVTKVFSNELNSWDGDEWDTKTNNVLIPAGATQLTAQLFSRDDQNTGLLPSSLTWIAGALNIEPPTPALEIKKFTNGADADTVNGTDVPIITPGSPITWTYNVTNAGSIPFSITEVIVSDDLLGTITKTVSRVGNMDDVLAPGETWIYQATGVAERLASNPPNVTIVTGCDEGGSKPSRPTYKNVGTVVGTSIFAAPVTDSDPSHYCNPLAAAIGIKKYTNSADADGPPGPSITVGDAVNWSYVVTNIGNVELTDINVTDDKGVIVNCPTTTTLAIGATMTCTGTGLAITGQYTNVGTAVGTPSNGGNPVTDTDISHYFGVPQPGVIGDYTWQDLDMDGLQDQATEPALANVTVELWQDSNSDNLPDALVSAQLSKLDGSYSFTDVTPGRYFVKFTPPAGYFLTNADQGDEPIDSDPDPSTNLAGPIVVTSGAATLTVDAGFIKYGTIGDLGWEDKNSNGRQDDGEPGMAGITVTLWSDANGDVQPDQSLATQQTAADGRYAISNLDPRRTYFVQFNLPTGRNFTTPNVPPDEARDSDAAQSTGFTGPIKLAFGEINATIDAGLLPPGASIAGYVLLRTAETGAINGYGGATITATYTSGTKPITVSTNNQGYYIFTELVSDTYMLEVDQNTLPPGAVPFEDRDGPPFGIVTATVATGEALTDVNFLYQTNNPPAQVRGRIWCDTDGDGTPNESALEPGLANVRVLLKDQQGTIQREQLATATGDYAFTNVTPGDYIIEVVTATLPGDYRQTFDPDPLLDDKTGLTVAAGQTYSAIDFGYQPLGYIAGLVWQGAIAPLPGITMKLTDSNGQLTLTQTNSAGSYSFVHLPPGTYVVCVDTTTLPTGSKPVTDPDAELDHCHTLQLPPKENRENINFGYMVPMGLTLSCKIDDVDATTVPGASLISSTSATWAYTVSNRSERALSNIGVVDLPLTISQCGVGRLDPGGSTSCVAAKSVRVGQQVTYPYATAQDEAGNLIIGAAQPCHYTGYTTGIVLTLAVNGEESEGDDGPYIVVNSPITWTYQVKNTGSATLTNTRISAVDGSSAPPDNGNVCVLKEELLPGDSASCTTLAIARRDKQTRQAQATGQPVDEQGVPLGERIAAQDQGVYYGGIPTLVLRPAEAERPIGLPHVVTATLTISGVMVEDGLPVHFQVIPAKGDLLSPKIQETKQGVATFSYTNIDNAQESIDQIVAWLKVNDPMDSLTDVRDEASVHWRQIVLTNTDTISSLPQPVRVVTAYVATKSTDNRTGAAVAGLRVGFTATVASGAKVPLVFGTSDGAGRVPFLITTDTVIAPTSPTNTDTILPAQATAFAAQEPLIGLTDLITLWVDIDANGILGNSEPFELVDATTAVPIAAFAHQRQAAAVQLRWATAVAEQYAGFNLYRSTVRDQRGTKLNNAAIGTDPESPFYYHFDDTLPSKGLYYYWLEGIGQDNQFSAPIGPFMVLWGEPFYLPLIHR